MLVGVSRNGTPAYTAVPGTSVIGPPAGQTSWDVTASGAGQQQLTWTPRTGSWAAAIMNADGSPGVTAGVTASVRSSAIGPIALALMGLGMILLTIGTALIVTAVVRARRDGQTPPEASTPTWSTPATSATAPDRPAGGAAGGAAYGLRLTDRSPSPVVVEARLDPALSRGLWIVKWFLAIPHFLVLAVLWFAFGIATFCAWFAILFTGRYPQPLFDFNVGVLRWTWRVAYYAGSGGLGSDRYPPFTLDPTPDDAAHLDVAYPGQLSRGLIFVKWLLLLPHWIVLAILTGPTVTWVATSGEHWQTSVPGILGLLTFVAALVLLFSGGYPKGLFDVIVGLNRWEYRVLAYAFLMTDSSVAPDPDRTVR